MFAFFEKKAIRLPIPVDSPARAVKRNAAVTLSLTIFSKPFCLQKSSLRLRQAHRRFFTAYTVILRKRSDFVNFLQEGGAALAGIVKQ